MKLTSTNRPFGLIIKLSQTVFEEEADITRRSYTKYRLILHSNVRLGRTCNASQSSVVALATSCSEQEQGNSYASFKFPGDHTARVTPVPIPNTEVKPRRADDTARATVWERRSSPGLKLEKAAWSNPSGLFVFPGDFREVLKGGSRLLRQFLA